jgi:CubicO group peptidase (beta-lactamase class C family)
MQSVAPEEAGLSSARLQRIARVLQAAIDRGDIAGAVTLIARHGKIAHCEAVGLQDIASRTPMRPDTIFRIRSMTKPVTAVATLLLYEEGHFLLNDPVAKFLPGFAETKVFVRETATGIEVADLERPITIRHLLLHTAGLTYDFDPSPVGKLYLQEHIGRGDEALDVTVRRLAQLPLVHQPGSGWTYGMSTDVLGRLVEAIADQPFDAFLEERIFDPLAMHDTGFFVPSGQRERLATLYTSGEHGCIQPDLSPGVAYVEPPRCLWGGHGLVSTAADYARFCQMLLNGGTLDGERVLGRATVGLMLADHLPGQPRPFPPGFPIPEGYGMALAGATLRDGALAGLPASRGSYGWSGLASTRFWIDPMENLTGIFMIQLTPFSDRVSYLFEVLTYQARTD